MDSIYLCTAKVYTVKETYEVSELEFLYAKFDYPCPRCNIKKLSDYKQVEKKWK